MQVAASRDIEGQARSAEGRSGSIDEATGSMLKEAAFVEELEGSRVEVGVAVDCDNVFSAARSCRFLAVSLNSDSGPRRQSSERFEVIAMFLV